VNRMNIILTKISLAVFSCVIISLAVYDIQQINECNGQKEKVHSYIQYESDNILSKRSIIINRIKTSINFKSDIRRKEFIEFIDLDSLSTSELENLVLTLFPNTKSLDSIYFYGDDIAKIRNQMLNSKNKKIRTFSNNLLALPILEALAQEVFDDTNFGWNDFELVRSIESDSVYIAALGDSDGRSKFAFRINGKYFTENNSAIYRIPKSDTIKIETLELTNEVTHIDTLGLKQTIVKTGSTWNSYQNKGSPQAFETIQL